MGFGGFTFRPGAWRSLCRGLHHRPEGSFSQGVGDAIGFGDVFGKVPAVLPGDRLARPPDISDARLIGAWVVWGCVHGGSP